MSPAITYSNEGRKRMIQVLYGDKKEYQVNFLESSEKNNL